MKTLAQALTRGITPLLLFIPLNLMAATDFVKGRYDVDPAHTRVSFVIPHFVVSEVEGRFNDVKGEFTLAEPFTNTKVSATIPVKSIDTGVAKRDEHLRSKDFFEVEKFPEMKLVSKSITGTPEAFKMVAALTIKGVTKDVTFDGKYTGSVKDPWGQQRAALQASATINRKDFGINYNDKVDIGPAVGDEVKIRIWTEGVKAEDAQKGPPKK
ncbi:MAG TPA: YceI family protein [Oligoflexus sp.]|uniref:YceI family protein n=1 Tax=Oligoflexus sp. TaxID=1971216 RepID=UPI002D80177E|nr:YceI family protein [Oligoflexus sp.]HET9235777.1 YceI family protein [Oligoflexus sp.]